MSLLSSASASATSFSPSPCTVLFPCSGAPVSALSSPALSSLAASFRAHPFLGPLSPLVSQAAGSGLVATPGALDITALIATPVAPVLAAQGDGGSCIISNVALLVLGAPEPAFSALFSSRPPALPDPIRAGLSTLASVPQVEPLFPALPADPLSSAELQLYNYRCRAAIHGSPFPTLKMPPGAAVGALPASTWASYNFSYNFSPLPLLVALVALVALAALVALVALVALIFRALVCKAATRVSRHAYCPTLAAVPIADITVVVTLYRLPAVSILRSENATPCAPDVPPEPLLGAAPEAHAAAAATLASAQLAARSSITTTRAAPPDASASTAAAAWAPPGRPP